MLATTKMCNECKVEKPAEDFFQKRDHRGSDKTYLSAACKPCSTTRLRRHRESRKAEFGSNGIHLMRTFGISVEQYREMHQRQEGLCAICGEENVRGMSLAVDHDHQTGQVRGLLCNPCNSAIGLFADDEERLIAAINYLKENA